MRMRNSVFAILSTVTLTLTANAADRVALNGGELLELLENERGWSLIDEHDDGLELLQREIPEADLHAILVRRPMSVDPRTVTGIVEDVARYEEVVVSATTVDFAEIVSSDSLIYGYQYFHIPLMKNRHLVFGLQRVSVNSDSTRWQVDWTLVPGQSAMPDTVHAFIEQRNRETNDPVLMYPGAGSYRVEKLDDGRWMVSYRLYIDPGGWLPNWIVERANRAGLINLFNDIVNEANRLQANVGES
jgi:hypothetical protein